MPNKKASMQSPLDPLIVEARLKLTEHANSLLAGKVAVICAKKLFDQCQGRWDVYRQVVAYLVPKMNNFWPPNGTNPELAADGMLADALPTAQELIRYEGAWEKEREG